MVLLLEPIPNIRHHIGYFLPGIQYSDEDGGYITGKKRMYSTLRSKRFVGNHGTPQCKARTEGKFSDGRVLVAKSEHSHN